MDGQLSELKILIEELEKVDSDIDNMVYMLDVKRKKKRFLQDEILKCEDVE